MHKLSIVTLLLVSAMTLTCNYHDPSAPDKAAHVTFEITCLESGPAGLSMPVDEVKPSHQAAQPGALMKKSAAALKSIDKVRVVFYTLDVDYETISKNYENN